VVKTAIDSLFGNIIKDQKPTTSVKDDSSKKLVDSYFENLSKRPTVLSATKPVLKEDKFVKKPEQPLITADPKPKTIQPIQ